MFNISFLREFFHHCPPTHGVLTEFSAVLLLRTVSLPWPCSAVFQAQVGFGTASPHGALVKNSVRHLKDFCLLSLIGPLLLTLQKGIYYWTKPHEFNSAPALLIFRPAHSIILLYCWLSSVSIHDLLGDGGSFSLCLANVSSVFHCALTSTFPHMAS